MRNNNRRRLVLGMLVCYFYDGKFFSYEIEMFVPTVVVEAHLLAGGRVLQSSDSSLLRDFDFILGKNQRRQRK